MTFAECTACHRGVRVWEGLEAAGLTSGAASASDAAHADRDRRFTCPLCGSAQRLPTDGVYVIYDRVEGAVCFVGRSKDAVRRLAWWQRPGGTYADRGRYRGVQVAVAALYPDLEWFASGDA